MTLKSNTRFTETSYHQVKYVVVNNVRNTKWCTYLHILKYLELISSLRITTTLMLVLVKHAYEYNHIHTYKRILPID